MTPEEALAYIAQGEGETIEFKRSLAELRQAVRSACAFANTRGGVVFIGVRNDGEIVGIEPEAKGANKKVSDELGVHIRPPLLNPSVAVLEIGGRQVIVIEVLESMDKPHVAYKSGYGEKRVGATNQELTRAEHEWMLQQRSLRLAYDRQPVPGAQFEDLALDRVETYLRHRRHSPRLRGDVRGPEETLRAVGLLARDDTPTVAALLLFGEYPQRFFTQASVTAAHFRGNEVDNRRLLDRADIEGTVGDQIEEAVRFVLRRSPVVSRIEDVRRQDIPRYPEPAVREAVANAVIHRDYRLPATVSVQIFDDRLEVWNAGGLVQFASVEELLAEPHSYPRNELLMRTAQDLKLVERLASGIRQIQEAMRANGSPTPIFEAGPDSFKVTLRTPEWMVEALASDEASNVE